MGDIIADLNRRRGQVESMDSRIGARVITAKVPLAEQFGYVTVLRTPVIRTCKFFYGIRSLCRKFRRILLREVVEKANGRGI